MPESVVPASVRFNEWREWRALAVSVPDEHFFRVDQDCRRIHSVDVAAVVQYFQLTGYLGVEFVVVTSYVDAAPFRRFGEDLVLVPCKNVLAAAAEASDPPSRDLIYDGWLPLMTPSEEAIVSGLRHIDEVVAMIAHAHGCECRWIVKYTEARAPRNHRTRHLTDDDQMHLVQETEKLRGLPSTSRAAVACAMAWLGQSRGKARQADRFLALWFAMESLLLVLYKDAAAVGLPILEGTPHSERGKRPSIRHRTERTLAAIFGAQDPASAWPYTTINGGLSPAHACSDKAGIRTESGSFRGVCATPAAC